MTWQDKVLAATCETRLGCILRCAMGRNSETDFPRFQGKAVITSDGYLTGDFYSEDGAFHHGAFVGDVHDFERNVQGLCEHLGLEGDDKMHFYRAARDWIETDYRQTTGLLLA